MDWRDNWSGTNAVKLGVSRYQSPKIAISLHVFYEEFVDRFATRISELNFQLDVFVTSPDDDICQKAIIAFGNLDNVNNVIVRKVPNIGRNFGPLVVEFGSQLLSYDVIGHFHSKKSLYSGREQSEWADYLFDSLLDPARSKFHLLALLEARHENIGLVFPTTPPSLPFWGNHWLRNVELGRHWARQLGVELNKFGFFTYPMGGMFWARTDALKQLFSYPWSYDDFPQESGQIDGTTHHAIERLVAVCCESNGYKKVAFHPEANAGFSDDSYVFEGYLSSLQNLSSDYLVQIEHLSLDLFDTIISRTNPFDDYQKLLASKDLGFIDSKEYLDIRNSSELELRISGKYDDVDLAQIAVFMLEKYRSAFSNQTLPEDIVEAEISSELSILRPKPLMKDVVLKRQSYGKLTTIVTDTYYQRNQIERILKSVGISLDNLKIEISSESGLRKDNGTYWKKLSESQTFGREDFLHVGDNVVSDVQIPGDYGFRAMYLANARDLASLLGKEIKNDFESSSNLYSISRLGIYQNPFLRPKPSLMKGKKGFGING
jgi:FMN phosphatase YigB (HAD superfamily)